MILNKSSFFAGLFLSAMLLIPIGVSAQVTIGSSNPPSEFSLLDLDTSIFPRALHLPRLTEDERDALVPHGINVEAKGLMIFNRSTQCLEFWNGEVWISLCDGRTNGGGDCEPVTTAIMEATSSTVLVWQSFDLKVNANGSNENRTYTWQWIPAFSDDTGELIPGYFDMDMEQWVSDPDMWSTFAITTSNNTDGTNFWAEFLNLTWWSQIHGFFFRVIVSNCDSTSVTSEKVRVQFIQIM